MLALLFALFSLGLWSSTQKSESKVRLIARNDTALGPEQRRRVRRARWHFYSRMEIHAWTYETLILRDPDMMATTIYRMHFSCGPSDAMANGWTVDHRFSQFFDFRKKWLRQVRSWEKRMEQEGLMAEEELVSLSNVLRRPLLPDFPKRTLFKESPSVVEARKEKLTVFVRKLLGVFADLQVFLEDSRVCASSESEHMADVAEMEEELRQFLQVPSTPSGLPQSLLDSVLSLRGVEVSESNWSCSVCFERYYTSSATALLSPAEDNARIENGVVELSCHHQFHECCLLDWFVVSTTCPICRHQSQTKCET